MMRRIVEHPPWVTPIEQLPGTWTGIHMHSADHGPESTLLTNHWGENWVVDHLVYVERPWFRWWPNGPFSRELTSVGVRYKA